MNWFVGDPKECSTLISSLDASHAVVFVVFFCIFLHF